MSAIDVSGVGNFITSVDVYRVFADFSQASTEFQWDSRCAYCGGSGCSMCTPSTQEGCFTIRDYNGGVVIPVPGTYDAASATWIAESWTESVEPDEIKAWYYAGEVADRFSNGYQTDPLSEFWAQVIAWITTARLERPICGCTNIQAVAEKLRFDLAVTSGDVRSFVTSDVTSCPFGTHAGEVLAWRRIKYAVKDKIQSFALV